MKEMDLSKIPQYRRIQEEVKKRFKAVPILGQTHLREGSSQNFDFVLCGAVFALPDHSGMHMVDEGETRQRRVRESDHWCQECVNEAVSRVRRPPLNRAQRRKSGK